MGPVKDKLAGNSPREAGPKKKYFHGIQFFRTVRTVFAAVYKLIQHYLARLVDFC